MIVGLGVDVVDLARFERAITRTPRLRERLFAAEELESDGQPRSIASLAARFAAKEAAQKAIGTAAEHAASVGAQRLHVSMSHDAGIATATVIAES